MIPSSSVDNVIKASLWALVIAFVCVAIYGVSEWRGSKISEERELITEIMVGEQYDTENITLLKELEDEEGYLNIGFAYLVLTTIIAICLFYVGNSTWRNDGLSEERESMTEIMTDVVTVAREQYDTENITLLKELDDEEGYLKYELLVEGKIKQAIYIKDTSEVVVID